MSHNYTFRLVLFFYLLLVCLDPKTSILGILGSHFGTLGVHVGDLEPAGGTPGGSGHLPRDSGRSKTVRDGPPVSLESHWGGHQEGPRRQKRYHTPGDPKGVGG